MFNCVRNCQTIFQSGCALLHSHQQRASLSVYPQLRQCVLSVFLLRALFLFNLLYDFSNSLEASRRSLQGLPSQRAALRVRGSEGRSSFSHRSGGQKSENKMSVGRIYVFWGPSPGLVDSRCLYIVTWSDLLGVCVLISEDTSPAESGPTLALTPLLLERLYLQVPTF